MFAMAPNELWKTVLPLFNLVLIIAYILFLFSLKRKEKGHV